MKTWTKVSALAIAATVACTVSASAANFTNCADDLNAMGLFSGTELGYELDRAPERGEAAVMLVRLLGAEAEAIAENNATPFTDVPDWAAPYVGWLYANGLTAGATDTTYEPYGACSAQMYATFLMRALGYDDAAGDFSYATAIDFALEQGVLDIANYNPQSFLRDHMVAMSYTALATTPKEADTSLLATLVDAGAIDADAAAPILADFDAFYAVNDLVISANAQTQYEMQIVGAMSMNAGDLYAIDMDMDLTTAAIMDLEDMNSSQMAIDGTIVTTISATETGESQVMEIATTYYYADGMYYMEMDGEKMAMELDYSSAMEQSMAGFDLTQLAQSNPICYYDGITENADGSYTITFDADAYMASVETMMGSLTGVVDTTMPGVVFNTMDITMTIGADGNMQSCTYVMDMTLEEGELTTQISMDMLCTILAAGDDVTVTLPDDLDSYTVIIGYADGNL